MIWEVEVKIAEVVDEDDEDTDDSEVDEVAKEDQEGGEFMMEEVLVVVSRRFDKYVGHQSVQVLAEGHKDVYLHSKCVLSELWSIQIGIDTLISTTEPSWYSWWQSNHTR